MPDFNDPNISEECLRCREKVISKSKNNTFDIECSGIFPADYKLEHSIGRPLTDIERDAAKSLLDPVGWAKEVLDWEPRVSRKGVPYQATMLRCDAKRIVSRIGRRCVVGDTLVLMEDGTHKEIKNIDVGEYVASKDKGALVSKEVLDFFDNGIQDIYEIETRGGSKIRCTSNHPFWWLGVYSLGSPWRSIDDGLLDGDMVATFDNNRFGAAMIRSITKVGKEQTYCITVADTHNFIANGFVTKNSGKSDVMAVDMLYNATTKKNHKILVVCPQKSHAQVVYERLSELIDGSADLKTSLRRSIKTPHAEIEFHNNSTIKLFTSGSKSGSEGQSVRGQTAHKIYLDEADYLCFSPNSLIELEDGQVKKAKDSNIGDSIHAFKLDVGKNVLSSISKSREKKNETLVRIKSSYGTIDSTVDHTHFVLSNNGIEEKKASDIGVGDFFIHPKRGVLGKRKVDLDWCRFAGYFLGDGHADRKRFHSIFFTGKDKENLGFYLDIARKKGFKNKGSILNTSGKAFVLGLHSKDFLLEFKELFPSLFYKNFSDDISKLDEKSLSCFLSGFYDAEGSVNLTRSSVVLTQGSRDKILFIRMLLMKLGILSSLSAHPPSGFRKEGFCYQLEIAEDKFMAIFAKKVGFNDTTKSGELAKCIKVRQERIGYNYSNLRYHKGYFNEVFSKILVNIKCKFDGKQIVFDSINRGVHPTLHSVEKLIKGLNKNGYKDFAEILESMVSFYASPISKIEKIKNEYGYVIDISVPETSNFFANGILTHNCDEDHNAISAILYSSPESTIWSSSTPTGKRQRFYEQCHDSRFREFHYASSVLPFWNDQMDIDARLDCATEAAYEHEILANFSEETQGVYQNKYIDRSLQEYKIEDQKRMDGWTYCMGVDWNDTKIGTQIVVVGYNPVANKYRIVAKHCVDKVGWTQLIAIGKIKEVNEYWRCDHVYCDEGFGGVQISLLQQYGENRLAEVGATHPDSMLRYVKGINAGSNLETRNIRTGIIENKPAKPYMIENSVRYFEHGIMELSKHDEELEQELLGYVVERRTQSGAPVYAQGDKRVGDHVLDAMVLALLAFTMEYTEFGQILTRSYVSFGASFGESSGKRRTSVPGTIEIVIEEKYKRKRAEEKRDAAKPQGRFEINNDNILNRGVPGMVAQQNSDRAVRKDIKRLKHAKPVRSNI